MGLSNFPSPSEGVLPVLVMNTVMSVAILKNLLRAFLEIIGANTWISTSFEEDPTIDLCPPPKHMSSRRSLRGITITKFKNLVSKFAPGTTKVECCVCLCKFREQEEVSELSCKHFFHKNCLDKWFDNHHTTCPLCRSIH